MGRLGIANIMFIHTTYVLQILARDINTSFCDLFIYIIVRTLLFCDKGWGTIENFMFSITFS